MSAFTLTQQQYEALISLARIGATTPGAQRALDVFLRGIEVDNNVVRSLLWIQWQEMDQPVPTNVEFPRSWPPEQRYFLEFTTRPISKADVNAVVAKKAVKPTNILVTPDPAAIVGWTELDVFFTE